MSALAERADAADIAATRLSLERTFIGAERTMMATVRTAFAMLTFSFTVFQTFALGARAKLVDDEPMARWLAMAIDVLAIVMMALAIWNQEYSRRAFLARVRLAPIDLGLRPEDVRRGPAPMLAGLVLLLAVAALAITAFRLLG